MKTTIQVLSWICLVLGVLAIIGGFTSVDAYGNQAIDGYSLLGGILFFTQGLLTVIYIGMEE
jgi:hypothetical protein